jgi:hypothetical protein
MNPYPLLRERGWPRKRLGARHDLSWDLDPLVSQDVGMLELYTSKLDCRTSPITSPEYPGQPPS